MTAIHDMKSPLLANLRTMPDARTLLPSLPRPRTPDQRAYGRRLVKALLAQVDADLTHPCEEGELALRRALVMLKEEA